MCDASRLTKFLADQGLQKTRYSHYRSKVPKQWHGCQHRSPQQFHNTGKK